MQELSQSDFDALPAMRAQTQVSELKAVFVHRALTKKPVRILCADGQFRVSKALWQVAEQAAYATLGGYEGPTTGVLSDLLRTMASAGLESWEDTGSDDEVLEALNVSKETTIEPEKEDPLGLLAMKLAKEALQELQTRTDKAVKIEFAALRGEVLRRALEKIGC